ncbi:MAG: hypothetical protein JRF49_07210 [Deltaproteobacteria bacterium]|nr:hypothetical protein [Deltaproteobacteria bacterium]
MMSIGTSSLLYYQIDTRKNISIVGAANVKVTYRPRACQVNKLKEKTANSARSGGLKLKQFVLITGLKLNYSS